MPGGFSEDDHPRDPAGKFSSGGGGSGDAAGDGGGDTGSGDSAPSAADRATASLRDRAFIGQHRERLQSAANEHRRYGAKNEHGNVPDKDVDAAIHREATRIHEEADAEAGLAAADAAGHLKPEPAEVGEYEALDADYEPANQDVHDSGQAAIGRLEELHALSDEDAGVGQDHELDDVESVAGALDSSTGLEVDLSDPEVEGLDYVEAVDGDHPGHPDSEPAKPSRDEFEDGPEGDEGFKEETDQYAQDHAAFVADRAEYNEQKKAHDEYTAKVAARQAAYSAKAVEAQDAFEALHEKQVAAIGRIKAIDKARDKAMSAVDNTDEDSFVNKEAFAHHERDEDDPGIFADDDVQADYERAKAASELRQTKLSNRLDEPTERDPETMAEAASATKSLIKQLAKITGRKPRLPAKTVKPKKSNRPDGDSTASVGVMARHKLRLSRLELISLVDQPAQATAVCRLIKRNGAPDKTRVKATAKFIKLDETGRGPLAYFWAFTCTDETGAPYHDLQGDAIAPDAYIKAAEEFMQGGGGMDDMHDGQQNGRVAFAFPMDSDIASAMFGKAVGGQVKTSGLMIAMRPSVDQLAKLRSGERTGVSIFGTGTREIAKARKPKGKDKKPSMAAPYKSLRKAAVLTSEDEGHAHSLDLDDPASCWSSNLSTSSQTAAGSDASHSHAWTYDVLTGAITIAPDSGHTHTVTAIVPADVIADAAADDDEDECAGDEDEGGRSPVIVVQAGAPGSKSSPRDAAATVTSQEQAMATEHESKIAELTKACERLAALANLTDAHKAYHATLSPFDSTAFLAKSGGERDAIVEPLEVAKRAAQEVVYVSDAGETYRKSHDPTLVAMAKRLDASERASAQVTLEKRAGTELSHFAKAVGVRAAIVKAIDGIADEAVRKEAQEAVKGANAALAILGKAHGGNDGADPVGDDPVEKFNAGLESFAKSASLSIPAATVEFLKTAQGAELYAGTLVRN